MRQRPSELLGLALASRDDRNRQFLLDEVLVDLLEDQHRLRPRPRPRCGGTVWPSCQRNSVVRRNGRVRFSQRTTFAHWLIEDGQVAVALHPLRVHIPDDRLGGRAHDQRLLKLLVAGARHPGDLRREPFDVLGLAFQEAARDEEREVGVDVPRRLDAVVQQAQPYAPKARSHTGGSPCSRAPATRRPTRPCRPGRGTSGKSRRARSGPRRSAPHPPRRLRFSFHRSCLTLPTGISAPRRAKLR